MNLMRSIVVPQTIASDTAQKTNWKKKNAALLPSTVPSTRLPEEIVEPYWKKKPESPASQPAPPNAMAKPQAHHTIEEIEKFVRIFATTAPTFFPREKPSSRNRNPACMNITRQAATITQVVFRSVATTLGSALSCASAALGTTRTASSVKHAATVSRLRLILPPVSGYQGMVRPGQGWGLWTPVERSAGRLCHRVARPAGGSPAGRIGRLAACTEVQGSAQRAPLGSPPCPDFARATFTPPSGSRTDPP